MMLSRMTVTNLPVNASIIAIAVSCSDPLFFKEQSELADADCWCPVNQSEGDPVIGCVLVFGQRQ